MSSGVSLGPSEPPLPSQAEAVFDQGAVCQDSRAVQAERGCRTACAPSSPPTSGRVRRARSISQAEPGYSPCGHSEAGPIFPEVLTQAWLHREACVLALQTPRAALTPSTASQTCSPAGLKALFLLPCHLRRSLQFGHEALLQTSAALIDRLASKGGRERQFKLLSHPKQTD